MMELSLYCHTEAELFLVDTAVQMLRRSDSLIPPTNIYPLVSMEIIHELDEALESLNGENLKIRPFAKVIGKRIDEYGEYLLNELKERVNGGEPTMAELLWRLEMMADVGKIGTTLREKFGYYPPEEMEVV